ncbi:hypothetical protein ACJX0J_009379, partial [Zea mays]
MTYKLIFRFRFSVFMGYIGMENGEKAESEVVAAEKKHNFAVAESVKLEMIILTFAYIMGENDKLRSEVEHLMAMRGQNMKDMMNNMKNKVPLGCSIARIVNRSVRDNYNNEGLAKRIQG